MKKNAKHALIFAAAIVGGIAAGMRCDASEWVDNSSQTNPRGAAYTVKTYTEGSDPFDAIVYFERVVCRKFRSVDEKKVPQGLSPQGCTTAEQRKVAFYRPDGFANIRTAL